MSLLSAGSNDNYMPLYDINAHNENWNLREYKLTTSQALRFGISIRGLYSVMNAKASDEEEEDPTKYVSYGKVERMFQSHGAELETEHEDIMEYEHIGFDGKSSGILKEHCQVEKSVDKVTFTCQSRRTYINHLIPESGHGISVAKSLYEVCKNTNSLDSVKSISCDGCRVNTGWENGALRKFEEMAGREIQHLVCDLHLNEKVFQKVFIKIGKLIF